jgi:uncharacterized membrane protein (DUF485 family)
VSLPFLTVINICFIDILLLIRFILYFLYFKVCPFLYDLFGERVRVSPVISVGVIASLGSVFLAFLVGYGLYRRYKETGNETNMENTRALQWA